MSNMPRGSKQFVNRLDSKQIILEITQLITGTHKFLEETDQSYDTIGQSRPYCTATWPNINATGIRTSEYRPTTTTRRFTSDRERFNFRSFYPDHHQKFHWTTSLNVRAMSPKNNATMYFGPWKPRWLRHRAVRKFCRPATKSTTITASAWLFETSRRKWETFPWDPTESW